MNSTGNVMLVFELGSVAVKRWTIGSSICLLTTGTARQNPSGQPWSRVNAVNDRLIVDYILGELWSVKNCSHNFSLQMPVHTTNVHTDKQACWFAVSRCGAVFQVNLFGALVIYRCLVRLSMLYDSAWRPCDWVSVIRSDVFCIMIAFVDLAMIQA